MYLFYNSVSFSASVSRLSHIYIYSCGVDQKAGSKPRLPVTENSFLTA